MTRPTTGPGPFRPDELDGVPDIGVDELAAEARLARDLEAVAQRSSAAPPAGFADRVMASIAAEPMPAPARAAGSAVRHGALAGLLLAIRDSFRVTFSGGFPAAARAQALALALVVTALEAARHSARQRRSAPGTPRSRRLPARPSSRRLRPSCRPRRRPCRRSRPRMPPRTSPRT